MSIIKNINEISMSYTSRLNPTQLDNLNLSFIESSKVKREGHLIEDGSVMENEEVISEYQKISKDGTSYYVFKAASDIKNKRNRENIDYINNVLNEFTPDNLEQKITMLIPLMQSRLWKKHCVLVEITIENGEKKIIVHDSRAWWRNLFYPNCLNDLKKQGYQVKYTNYAKQKDSYSCTYFVYQFIKKILENFNRSESIREILKRGQFDSLNILNGEDPIGQLIQRNFGQEEVSFNSGEVIPWKEVERKYYFSDKETIVNEDEDGFVVLEENNPDSLTKVPENKNTGITLFQAACDENKKLEQPQSDQNLTY